MPSSTHPISDGRLRRATADHSGRSFEPCITSWISNGGWKLELRVLGQVEERDRRLARESPRHEAPRAVRAPGNRANRPVTGEQLIDELWRGNSPPSAATPLRVQSAERSTPNSARCATP